MALSLKFNPFTSCLDWVSVEDLSGYLQLDQTTPQTVINGIPTFDSGIKLSYLAKLQGFNSLNNLVDFSFIDINNYFNFGTSATNGFYLGQSASQIFATTVGAGYMNFATKSAANALRIAGNGWMGILNSTPLGLLDVGGSVIITSSTSMPASDAACMIIRSGTGSGDPFVSTGSLILRPRVSASNGRGSIFLMSGSPSLTRMRIDETGNIRITGNVGIGTGTATPGEKLVVQGTTTPGGRGQVSVISFDDKANVWRGALNISQSISDTVVAGTSVGITLTPRASTGSSFLGTAKIAAIRPNATVNNQDTDLAFYTRTGASNVVIDREVMRITHTGNVGIGTATPGEKLEIDGNLFLNGDNDKFYLGTGKDLSIDYDGTKGNIRTDLVAPSDLNIDCGTDKTLVLEQGVWRDENIAGVLLSKPASSAPRTDTFRTSAATDTGIETYAFAVGEKVHGGFELQHDYKEGTDLTFHVHFQIIAAPTGTDNVQWRLTYILHRDGVTLDTVTTIDSPDTAVDTQYSSYRSDFGAITGTNFKIGDQIMFTLERVAATGDAFAGECLMETAGIHYRIDTLGSRTIRTK